MEITVKGHSGCQIDVVTEGDAIYVYKSTADPKYLNRLAMQAKKQEAAGMAQVRHIRVPRVFHCEQTETTTVVKMQYVYSKNFIEFFEQAGFEQIEYLIDSLKHFIDYEVELCEQQVVSADVFRVKFAEIESRVRGSAFYQENEAIAALINDCRNYFDALDALTIPVGVCHGDLTFSNILFNGNNYYLIDFLDSFVETPLQDIAKIRQDTAYRWSQLMYTKRYDALRLRLICDKIDREIDGYFSSKYPWYSAHYRTLQLMNILRILPYAREERVITYLVNILKSLLYES